MPRPLPRRPLRQLHGRSAPCCSPSHEPSAPVTTSRAGARRGDRPTHRDTLRCFDPRARRSPSHRPVPTAGYWCLTITNRGSRATRCDRGSPVAASKSSTVAIATKLSRTNPTRGSITPPLPSPPRIAPSARIRSTTLISPTEERCTGQPNSRAIASVTFDVERLITTGPLACDNRRTAARARVSSSPM